MNFLKSTILTLLIATATVSSLHAQQIIESQQLPPFSAIKIEGPIRAELFKSDTARVHLTLWDISQNEVDWRIKDGTLLITARRGMINKMAYVDLKLYYTDLNKITNSGAEIRSQDTLLTSMLQIDALNSVGDIELNVRCAELNISTSGQNRMMLGGTADYCTMRAKLGSIIECYKLEANTVDATATEGASIELRAKDKLSLRAFTLGHIRYIVTRATIINAKRNTSGKLTAISAQ